MLIACIFRPFGFIDTSPAPAVTESTAGTDSTCRERGFAPGPAGRRPKMHRHVPPEGRRKPPERLAGFPVAARAKCRRPGNAGARCGGRAAADRSFPVPSPSPNPRGGLRTRHPGKWTRAHPPKAEQSSQASDNRTLKQQGRHNMIAAIRNNAATHPECHALVPPPTLVDDGWLYIESIDAIGHIAGGESPLAENGSEQLLALADAAQMDLKVTGFRSTLYSE